MKQYENQLLVDLGSLDIAEGRDVEDHPVHVIGVAPHLEEIILQGNHCCGWSDDQMKNSFPLSPVYDRRAATGTSHHCSSYTARNEATLGR